MRKGTGASGVGSLVGVRMEGPIGWLAGLVGMVALNCGNWISSCVSMKKHPNQTWLPALMSDRCIACTLTRPSATTIQRVVTVG